jgi:hypothetical protein
MDAAGVVPMYVGSIVNSLSLLAAISLGGYRHKCSVE